MGKLNKPLITLTILALIFSFGFVARAIQADAWNIGGGWLWFAESGNGNYRGNVETPIDDSNIANKAYVDSISGGGIAPGTDGQTLYNSAGDWTATSNLYHDGSNVGIGTTSPQGTLDISATNDPDIYLSTGENDWRIIHPTSDNSLRFQYNTGSRLIITNPGNIGIGTTTPAYALDVSGGGRFSQPVFAGTPILDNHAATKSYVDSNKCPPNTVGISCLTGYLNCNGSDENASCDADGCEVNSDTDDNNCGSCGNTCGSNSHCSSGACTCDSGWYDCNGTGTGSDSDGCESSSSCYDSSFSGFSVCGDSGTYDGDTYGTIDINGQCWMTENMRTTTYPDGTSITKGPSSDGASGWDTDQGYYSCPPNSSNDGEDCAAADSLGMLYQWSAAMAGSTAEGAQGICPDGWHVASDAEWHALEDYLDEGTCDGSRDGSWDCDPAGSKLAGNDAADENWISGTLTGHSDFDSSGFNAPPSGYRYTNGSYYYRSFRVSFWSSPESGSSAWSRYLYYGYSTVRRTDSTKANGFSVRCLKN